MVCIKWNPNSNCMGAGPRLFTFVVNGFFVAVYILEVLLLLLLLLFTWQFISDNVHHLLDIVGSYYHFHLVACKPVFQVYGGTHDPVDRKGGEFTKWEIAGGQRKDRR